MAQCTATSKRTHERCKANAVTGRRVCRHHGGTVARGPASVHYRHGRYSKELPPRLLERFEASVADPNQLALDREIALLDALISDVVARLDTGESGNLWASVRTHWRELRAAIDSRDAKQMAAVLNVIEGLIERGQGEQATRSELGELLDRRARLAATEARRIQMAQQSLSASEAMMLVTTLAAAVRETVRDPLVLANIEAKFARIVNAGQPAAAEDALGV